ncbi:nucleophile aminohydrolase, partial [Mycena rosella]
YAGEAILKGTCAVGIRGKDVVVLGVEKKSVLQLQDPRTVRKVVMLDDLICLAFAGLTADGRVVIDKAKDPVPVEYITKHIAGIKQVCGVQPFGMSTLIVGFDPHDTRPRLYQTEPDTSMLPDLLKRPLHLPHYANAIGRSLTTNHKDDITRNESIKLAVKSLLEVVQTGAKNIEISVIENLNLAQIEAIVSEIEREKEAGSSSRARCAAAARARRPCSSRGPRHSPACPCWRPRQRPVRAMLRS